MLDVDSGWRRVSHDNGDDEMKPITWHTEKRNLVDLKRYERNPRQVTEKPFADLKESISKFGLAEPLVIQPDGTIIGGHARYEALKEQGKTEADCSIPDKALTAAQVKELNIRLNKNIASDWDWDILTDFEFDDLKDIGFGDEELKEGLGLEIKEVTKPEPQELTCPECGHVFERGK